MHKLTQTRPHDSMPSFQIGQAALKTGLKSIESSQPPVTKHYSANSFSRLAFTPFLLHPRRYLCTEPAPPNAAFHKTYHWHPVRRMCAITANPFLSMGLCPPAQCRKYLRLLSRLGFVPSGSARTKNLCEIVIDLMAFMGMKIRKIRRDGIPLLMEQA